MSAKSNKEVKRLNKISCFLNCGGDSRGSGGSRSMSRGILQCKCRQTFFYTFNI